MPLLDRFFERKQRQRMASARAWPWTNKPAVTQFLGATRCGFRLHWQAFAGIELSKSHSATSAVVCRLPWCSTQAGSVLHRKIGRVSADDLRVWRSLR
jgi:hypothetical protein